MNGGEQTVMNINEEKTLPRGQYSVYSAKPETRT